MLKENIRNLANNLILFQATLRGKFWKMFLHRCGNNFQVMNSCRILSPGGVNIGNNVYINHNCDIYGQGGVSIGNNVLVGPNSNILSVNHAFSDWSKPINSQGIVTKKVIIHNDVWIGANVTILPGVNVGMGSIIGANALVSKNVEPYSIVGGVPAKLIKKRFGKDIIRRLLKKEIK